ncbi:MAG: hypothetical protein IJ040_02545 [Lachnospiraceae bacterium]|nr:hypothetical protein [Lachnospiraceae bacterium]
MAKNKEEKAGAKFLAVVIVFLIVVVWIAAMIILIKLDVGNFGSQILRPVLKDVPVVKLILPPASDEEAAMETDLPYKNLSDALERIEALEAINADNEVLIQEQQEQLLEKDNEIARLRVFEDEQESFNEIKSEFYSEVVYGNTAPDADTYIEWYESIDAEAAEEIYRQVIAQQSSSDEIKELANTYAEMDPAAAAEILQTMGGNLDTVAEIMDNMTSTDKAEILEAMDPNFAANITKKLMP